MRVEAVHPDSLQSGDRYAGVVLIEGKVKNTAPILLHNVHVGFAKPKQVLCTITFNWHFVQTED